MADVDKAMYARTEADFEVARRHINTTYPEMHAYLEKEWWPWRSSFVSFWVNQYMHFGEVSFVSLAVQFAHLHSGPPDSDSVSWAAHNEGSHANLKGWLGSTRGDLVTLSENCLNWWEAGVIRFDAQRAKESIETIIDFTGPFFEDVVRKIYHYPLKKIWDAYGDAKTAIAAGHLSNCNCGKDDYSGRCAGHERTVFHRPCKHDLKRLIEENKVVRMCHFDFHWWINRTDHSQRLLLPVTKNTRQKHDKSKVQEPTRARGHGASGTARGRLLAEVGAGSKNIALTPSSTAPAAIQSTPLPSGTPTSSVYRPLAPAPPNRYTNPNINPYVNSRVAMPPAGQVDLALFLAQQEEQQLRERQ